MDDYDIDNPPPLPTATPMVAIVGRPNVGKSALFNRLAGRNIAIVHDRPGVTRDRLIATCTKAIAPFDIMDTGGIGEKIEDDFYQQVQAEAHLAMDVADLILFVVDGVAGLTPVDLELARILRKTTKPLVLAINKMDSEKRRMHGVDFVKLGFEDSIEVSAAHGVRIDQLVGLLGKRLELKPAVRTREADRETFIKKQPLKLAIVGRPNAGKSSLVNALAGKSRTIVSDVAGTTRDAIDIPVEHRGRKYQLIDTAGMRRKAKIHDEVETFSSMQATKSIKRADICLLMVDCSNITMQDRKIASIIVEQQKPCILLLNKYDLFHPGMGQKDRLEELMEQAGREFFFMRHAPFVALSAKEGQHLDKVFKAVVQVEEGAANPPGTGVLNRLLQRAIENAPGTTGRSGKSFKLLYATIKKEDKPPRIPVPQIVLFANRADKLQESYLRHLEDVIRTGWPAPGLPFTWEVRGKTRGDKPKPGGRPKAKAPKGDAEEVTDNRPKHNRPTKGTAANVWEKRPKNRVTRKRSVGKRKGG
ncbi:ribosome biogenesis GTPase Der [Roseimicrobium sp. ORNL1]|uniref:ribosome biogenesis GTPase Der n=1 Tax=Roseimicrobium sp. ORNL1 TaxID=2711231 RepID=UPI0013E1671E|nr:ribosome biogenesis GTPase Der [Roseimicrobium sp. ORNL1]QIF03590.1 ribosome biogenesis GTPase Der [Roseimicrobium sp. ORNL1]